jgi:S-adenosylmethionine hydrolase
MKNYILYFLTVVLLAGCGHPAVVFQTDFGLKDGAVAEMKGVALSVEPSLRLYDLTHEIPAYNIWEGAYRLNQAAAYWPEGTVFVSVVDPGVGTERKSVVLKTKSGHFFVTPDNGTLTLVAQSLGIDEVREIDEAVNRREGTEHSYTFFGRDVYAYTGARLASGKISFKEVGKRLPDSVITINYQAAKVEDGTIRGNIPVLDIQYGNVWTNIPESMVTTAGWKYGDSVAVKIFRGDSTVFSSAVPLVRTFGEVDEGKSLAYFNSLSNFSLAINMGSFSSQYKVNSGPEWTIIIGRHR